MAYNKYNHTLPKEYLVGGYYEMKSGKQILKSQYILEFAQDIARNLHDGKRNKNSQLRKFYGLCIRLKQIIDSGNDFVIIETEFKSLISFVTNAKTRDKVTQLFVDFICENVNTVKNKEDYHAFVKHFEAIMAYLPKDKN